MTLWVGVVFSVLFFFGVVYCCSQFRVWVSSPCFFFRFEVLSFFFCGGVWLSGAVSTTLLLCETCAV